MKNQSKSKLSKDEKKLYSEFSKCEKSFFIYGAAMYAAQPLEVLMERIIDGLIALGYIEFSDKKWDWESISETKQTLGKLTDILVSFLIKHFPKEDKKFRKLFTKCVQERNWLAHDFFGENHEYLESGLPENVIRRITVSIERFAQVVKFLIEISNIIDEYLSKSETVGNT